MVCQTAFFHILPKHAMTATVYKEHHEELKCDVTNQTPWDLFWCKKVMGEEHSEFGDPIFAPHIQGEVSMLRFEGYLVQLLVQALEKPIARAFSGIDKCLPHVFPHGQPIDTANLQRTDFLTGQKPANLRNAAHIPLRESAAPRLFLVQLKELAGMA